MVASILLVIGLLSWWGMMPTTFAPAPRAPVVDAGGLTLDQRFAIHLAESIYPGERSIDPIDAGEWEVADISRLGEVGVMSNVWSSVPQ